MVAQQVQVEVRALKAGMFVSRLDCPWHKTPFPLQGFYIQGEEDILAIQRHCRHVFIDVERGKVQVSYGSHAVLQSAKIPLQMQEKNAIKGGASVRSKNHVEEHLKLAPIVVKSPANYAATTSILKEVGKVEKLHKQVYEAIDRVYTLVQCGADIDIKETREVADGMVESVIRNPDALVWLAKMNEASSHAYQHSVKSAIWALVFGRHLGLDRHSLSLLAMGALLAQVGKSKLDPALLAIDPVLMDAEQHAEYERYVEHSLEILGAADHTPKGVLAIAEFHCERHNGSGFPKHVTGDQIPLLAKIVGLVDHYQDTIAPVDLAKGLSPLDAVTQLYEQRNVLFQQDLVERFIQAVGVYPTGTLVVLSTQEVAIVTGHNMDRRLQPKVLIVTDANKLPLKQGKVVDLKDWNTRQAGREPLFIKGSLPKGAFNIDENAYLVTGATSKWSFRHLTAALAG